MSDGKDNIQEYERRVKLMPAKESASCDYLLPDYLGDVKKILKYRADVVPSDKYSAAREVSFLYQVNYRVMYLDSQDVLTEAFFSGEFEHAEKLERECIDAYSDTRIESLAIRLQGPRKICAKAQMTTEVCIIESLPLPVLEDSVECEKNLCRVNIYSPEYVESAEREYAERIASLPDVSCDEAEIIKQSAIAVVEGVYSGSDGVSVKGSVFASALIRSMESVIRIEKKLPFEEVISADAFPDGARTYFAKAYITDAKLTLNNEMGEDGSDVCYCSAVLSYSLKCFLRINKNCEYELTRDAFVPGKFNSGEYIEFSYDELVCEANERRKAAFEIERPCGAIREIMECDAELKGVRCITEGEEIVVSADVLFSAVASLADDSGYAPVKHTARIEERVKLGGIDDSCHIDLSVSPLDVSISFDNEKLYPSLIMCVNASAVRPHKSKVMTGLVSEDCVSDKAPCMTVYYPIGGDTVWSVAKGHSVSLAELMKSNPLSSHKPDDSVSDMKYIMISK